MTDVRLDFRVPHAGGNPVPTTDGYWLFRPSRLLHVDGDDDNQAYAVLPDPFKAELVDGVAVVPFTPTGADWCWIGDPLGMVGLNDDRYFSVPDSLEVLDFYGPEIHDVDPATLDPTTPVSPAYQALIDAAVEAAAVADAKAVDAQELAAGALDAAGNVSTALADEVTARGEAVGQVDEKADAAQQAADQADTKADAAQTTADEALEQAGTKTDVATVEGISLVNALIYGG